MMGCLLIVHGVATEGNSESVSLSYPRSHGAWVATRVTATKSAPKRCAQTRRTASSVKTRRPCWPTEK